MLAIETDSTRQQIDLQFNEWTDADGLQQVFVRMPDETGAGCGEALFHHTGHGLETEVHEPPYISAGSQAVLEEGMVFSTEPGIYLPGRIGLRREEIAILRAGGPEIRSDLPRDLRVID